MRAIVCANVCAKYLNWSSHNRTKRLMLHISVWLVGTPTVQECSSCGDFQQVFVVYGTRPEGIKLSPVIQELKSRDAEFSTVVCVTAQHRYMVYQQLCGLRCTVLSAIASAMHVCGHGCIVQESQSFDGIS